MAVRFSASGQHYTDTVGLPGTVYTFTAWVWATAVGSRYRVVYWFRQTAGDHFSGIGIRDNPTDLQLMDDTTYWFSGAGPLSASGGTWYQIAGVVNGANATFYRSAAGSALTSASVTDFTPPTPNQLWLGADAFGGWWDGRIASVKIWNVALTAAEVERELTQYVPKRTANLLRWHPFVNADPTDYSGNGYTLSGGTGATTEDGPPIPWGSAIPLVLLPSSSGPAPTAVTGTATTAIASQAATRKVAVVSATSSVAVTGTAVARRTVGVAGTAVTAAVGTAAASKRAPSSGLSAASGSSAATSRKRSPLLGASALTAAATSTGRKAAVSVTAGNLAVAGRSTAAKAAVSTIRNVLALASTASGSRVGVADRKSTRQNSSHQEASRMPSSA